MLSFFARSSKKSKFMRKSYFNRVNFREIKFRDFAKFCPFREIKTRENVVWDCWVTKLNLREFFNIAFWVVQISPFMSKNCHFQLFSGSFAKFFKSLTREIKSKKFREFFGSRNLIRLKYQLLDQCQFNRWVINYLKIWYTLLKKCLKSINLYTIAKISNKIPNQISHKNPKKFLKISQNSLKSLKNSKLSQKFSISYVIFSWKSAKSFIFILVMFNKITPISLYKWRRPIFKFMNFLLEYAPPLLIRLPTTIKHKRSI